MTPFSASRPAFGKPPEAAGLNAKVMKAVERRAAQVREAASLCDHLPLPGCAFHAIMTGRYDLMDFVVALAARWGGFGTLRIATLSYNARNLTAILGLIDGGGAEAVTLLCSSFFRSHNAELWQESVEAFRERGMRLAAARSHAKVICFDGPSGERLVSEGSANLRTNSNIEQITLIADAQLHGWHSAWIDALVAKHEGENDDGGRG